MKCIHGYALGRPCPTCDSAPVSEPTFCRACGASIPHRIGEGRCPECIQHLPAPDVPTYSQLTVRIDGRGLTVIFDDGDGDPSHLQLPNTETNCRLATAEALSGLSNIYDLARKIK